MEFLKEFYVFNKQPNWFVCLFVFSISEASVFISVTKENIFADGKEWCGPLAGFSQYMLRFVGFWPGKLTLVVILPLVSHGYWANHLIWEFI